MKMFFDFLVHLNLLDDAMMMLGGRCWCMICVLCIFYIFCMVSRTLFSVDSGSSRSCDWARWKRKKIFLGIINSCTGGADCVICSDCTKTVHIHFLIDFWWFFDRLTMYVKFIELHDFFIVFSCRKWIQILLKNLLAAIGEFDRDWVLIAVELLIIENQIILESLEIVTDGLSSTFFR